MSRTINRVGANTKMTDDDARGESNRARNTTRPREASRRAVLRDVAATGAAVAWGSGAVAGAPGQGKGAGGPPGGGFPPKGITEYGPSVDLGNGSVRTFTTETPSGEPGTPEAFDNTRIQGFIRVGDAEAPRLAFVEPMVTRELLRGFDGKETYEIPQPEAYPHDRQHPTEHGVRGVPSRDAVTVVLGAFEPV